MANNKYYTHVKPNFTIIEGWVRDGMTDEQVAYHLGVAYSTFRLYVNKYEELAELMQRTKDHVDIQVENALLKRALGFEYIEEVITSDGREYVTKYEPPHPSSAMFWLRNRRPNKWRNTEKAQVDKLVADRKYVEAKTKLLEAVKQDTSLLQALIDVVDQVEPEQLENLLEEPKEDDMNE